MGYRAQYGPFCDRIYGCVQACPLQSYTLTANDVLVTLRLQDCSHPYIPAAGAVTSGDSESILASNPCVAVPAMIGVLCSCTPAAWASFLSVLCSCMKMSATPAPIRPAAPPALEHEPLAHDGRPSSENH